MGDRPLANRDVRLIVGAVGVSALGDFLLWIPLTLQIQEMTDSGLAVAALMISLWLPIVLLSPIAGLIVDRGEARRILIASSLAQMAVAAALALALDSVAAILVLAAVLGIFFSLSQPAEFALIPAIAGAEADAERLNRINGYVETSRYLGMTLGPLLGGALAAAGGVDVAMLVNAVTFGVVALAALLLHARRRGTAEGSEHDRARDGIVLLFRDRVLAIVLGAAFVSLLFFSASITAEVFFFREDLGVGDFVYGLLFSTWTIGMVVGSIFVSRRIAAGSLAAAALLMVGLQGIGLGSPTLLLVPAFAGVMFFIGGVGHGTKNVIVRTLIQDRVPGAVHGRAFAAYNGLRNGAEMFALAMGGLLVAAIGGRATLALAGAVPILVAAGGLAVYSRRAGSAEPEGEPASRAPAEPLPAASEPSPLPAPGTAE